MNAPYSQLEGEAPKSKIKYYVLMKLLILFYCFNVINLWYTAFFKISFIVSVVHLHVQRITNMHKILQMIEVKIIITFIMTHMTL